MRPLTPALEKIWAEALGASLADFNFRTVTSKFNELVYNYPIRIPERYSLVIRSLLTQVKRTAPPTLCTHPCPAPPRPALPRPALPPT